ncbi:DNA topoisomerase IB [Corallococcus terminator]|uniref:DNA topoisomerase IB n=1 Tax=Corallococcus terminator TaxID=2316733 RepID=UPI001FC937FA|nr:DNA topoisomerase IB [Corallococcus terminator]
MRSNLAVLETERNRRASQGLTQLELLRREGLRRVGTMKQGFRYVDANGRAVSQKERERIEALKLPPAWTEVAIATKASARLQAVGRDGAGRWQYRYSEAHTQRQQSVKFQRIVGFAKALPKMRRQVNVDLRKRGLSRDRVLAGMLRILGTCFIRPGSQRYAEEHGSFGLATLRARHVKVTGDKVVFDYPGKSGVRQHRELKDRRVATLVRQLLKVRGRDVFKFVLDDGAVVDVRRRHINEYIQQVMGPGYSAKDFRTWAGTLICACALARARAHVKREGDTGLVKKHVIKKSMVAAVREASEHLGNTPAVARASYIYPSVLALFERGQVVDRYFKSVDELAAHAGGGMHCSEKALLHMLGRSKEFVKQGAL